MPPRCALPAAVGRDLRLMIIVDIAGGWRMKGGCDARRDTWKQDEVPPRTRCRQFTDPTDGRRPRVVTTQHDQRVSMAQFDRQLPLCAFPDTSHCEPGFLAPRPDRTKAIADVGLAVSNQRDAAVSFVGCKLQFLDEARHGNPLCKFRSSNYSLIVFMLKAVRSQKFDRMPLQCFVF